MGKSNKPPARIHVLMASNSKKSVVLRRGPSWQTAVLGWNRMDDTFSPGQWLYGSIYGYRSDVTPDGNHWIYSASKHSQTHTVYTAVSRVPYLKVMDFYVKDNAWNGGGLFYDNNSYWLNQIPGEEFIEKRKSSPFCIIPAWPGHYGFTGYYATKRVKALIMRNTPL